MTQQKSMKRRVRARMSKTGERYTAARRQVLTQARPEPAPTAEPTPVSEPAPVAEPTPTTEARSAAELASDLEPTLGPSLAPVPDSPFRGGYGASDAALVQRTGQTWEHWYRLLDSWGGADRPHPEIARWLNEEQGVDGWWAQEVTVRYEMAIGRRVPGQRPDGFEATASKTFDVPVERLFEAVIDERQREHWLSRSISLRTATPHRTARFTWDDGPQRIAFWFTAKGARSNVAMAHQRMPDAETSAAMKAFWRDRLNALQAYLDGGR